MNFRLGGRDVSRALGYLESIHNGYILNITIKTRDVKKQSLQYAQALLLQRGRGNMSEYARNVPDSSSRQLTQSLFQNTAACWSLPINYLGEGIAAHDLK